MKKNYDWTLRVLWIQWKKFDKHYWTFDVWKYITDSSNRKKITAGEDAAKVNSPQTHQRVACILYCELNSLLSLMLQNLFAYRMYVCVFDNDVLQKRLYFY